MKIGFVGLGLMGTPMVERLINAGHTVRVFSANPQAVDDLCKRGAVAAQSIAGAADGVEIFCSCRVTPEQSRDVFVGQSGILAGQSHPLVCIDFATIDPMTAHEISATLATKGINYIDAPVSGGPDGVRAGTLTIIAGGEMHAIERAREIFDALGQQTFHMGGTGTGVTAKLCNNMISITTHVLVAEAFVLGVKAGIEATALYDVMRHSSAYSRTLERVVPGHFLPRNFEPTATLNMIMKDLRAAIDLANEEGVDLLLPAAAMERYVDAANQGHGADDIASVILPLEKAVGIRVGQKD